MEGRQAGARQSGEDICEIVVTPDAVQAGVDAYYRYGTDAYGVGEAVTRIIEATFAALAVSSKSRSGPKVAVCFDSSVADQWLSLGHTTRHLMLPLRQSCAREAL